MPEAALCPSCNAPIPDAAVIALAPVCRHCGVVLVVVGGSLGLTGVYGVGDASFTRKRVEADLEVHQQHRRRLEGLIADCHEKLRLPVKCYAQLPPSPELLAVREINPRPTKLLVIYYAYLVPLMTLLGVEAWIRGGVPDFWSAFFSFVPGFNLLGLAWAVRPGSTVRYASEFRAMFIVLAILGPLLVYSLHRALDHVVNGGKPAENARRKRAYDDAYAAAMAAAEPVNKAADHRLQMQIREAEAASENVTKSEQKIRQQFHRVQ